MPEVLFGHWAVTCLAPTRRALTMTLPHAEAVRKLWLGKYPGARVTIRPLTEAALSELYQSNGWPHPEPSSILSSADRGAGRRDT